MWLYVRKFGKLSFFNWSPIILVGVPVLAELYLELGKHIDGLKFPWVLKVGFFASVFYVLGFALYQFFCPESIKDYKTADAYAFAKLPVYRNFNPDQQINVILAQFDETQAGTRDELTRLIASRSRQDKEHLSEMISALYPSSAQKFLIREFGRDAKKRPVAAWTSLTLYCLGTIIALGLVVWRISVIYEVFKF
jgi:hypothetical protein